MLAWNLVMCVINGNNNTKHWTFGRSFDERFYGFLAYSICNEYKFCWLLSFLSSTFPTFFFEYLPHLKAFHIKFSNLTLRFVDNRCLCPLSSPAFCLSLSLILFQQIYTIFCCCWLSCYRSIYYQNWTKQIYARVRMWKMVSILLV